jgi:titin
MTMDGVHPLASAYQNAMAQAAFRAVLDVTPGALGATVPPSAPSGPTAVANGAGLDVTWTSNSRNESGFEVDWSASPYFASFATIQSAAGTTAAALTGLPATTLIFVRVRAKNAGGASWYTPPVRMTTETGSGSGGGGAALPAAPSGLSAVAASSSQITLSWTDNATNETGFVIERRSGSAVFAQVATVGAGVTTWADSGLTAATAYTYRVRATNAAGSSAFANEATATTSAAPVTAKPGDVNGDGSVNAADLNLVKSQFGRRSGDAGFLPACDLNLDGRIDSTDLSIVSRNQGR